MRLTETLIMVTCPGLFEAWMVYLGSSIPYFKPVKFGQLSLYSSVNISKENGDVTLFPGTSKTTLSTNPNHLLISNDEHIWSSIGVFDIKGGCYMKCINISAGKEPIYNAIHFGLILENVYNPTNCVPDYNDMHQPLYREGATDLHCHPLRLNPQERLQPCKLHA